GHRQRLVEERRGAGVLAEVPEHVAAEREERLDELLARAEPARGGHRLLQPLAGRGVVALTLAQLAQQAPGRRLGQRVAGGPGDLEGLAQAPLGAGVLAGERLDLAEREQRRQGLLAADL